MRYDFTIYSQSGFTMFGNVYDTYTEDGIAPNKAVNISLKKNGVTQSSMVRFTDGMGNFNFNVTSPGVWEMTFSLEGSVETIIRTV